MQSPFDTPVLFLVFNRPETTFRVFERIRQIQPTRLFIAADGPRATKSGEAALCEQVRSIVQKVDWPCEVQTLFRETNLGCGKAVSEAITWFFSQVESGIILEDDCLPSTSFFQFSSQLLQHYQYDTRVWHIAGYTVYKGNENSTDDYFFSEESPIWGWATWRRVWQHYQLHITELDQLEKTPLRKNIRTNATHALCALFDFKKVRAGKVNTWDYQYAFVQLVNRGLTITPSKNLVENIGFSAAATHTQTMNQLHQQNEAAKVDYSQIRHPKWMIPDPVADDFIYRKRTRLLKQLLIWPWYLLKYGIR